MWEKEENKDLLGMQLKNIYIVTHKYYFREMSWQFNIVEKEI